VSLVLTRFRSTPTAVPIELQVDSSESLHSTESTSIDNSPRWPLAATKASLLRRGPPDLRDKRAPLHTAERCQHSRTTRVGLVFDQQFGDGSLAVNGGVTHRRRTVSPPCFTQRFPALVITANATSPSPAVMCRKRLYAESAGVNVQRLRRESQPLVICVFGRLLSRAKCRPRRPR